MYPVLANNLAKTSIYFMVDTMVGNFKTSLLSVGGVVTECTVSSCDCNPLRYYVGFCLLRHILLLGLKETTRLQAMSC